MLTPAEKNQVYDFYDRLTQEVGKLRLKNAHPSLIRQTIEDEFEQLYGRFEKRKSCLRLRRKK